MVVGSRRVGFRLLDRVGFRLLDQPYQATPCTAHGQYRQSHVKPEPEEFGPERRTARACDSAKRGTMSPRPPKWFLWERVFPSDYTCSRESWADNWPVVRLPFPSACVVWWNNAFPHMYVCTIGGKKARNEEQHHC